MQKGSAVCRPCTGLGVPKSILCLAHFLCWIPLLFFPSKCCQAQRPSWGLATYGKWRRFLHKFAMFPCYWCYPVLNTSCSGSGTIRVELAPWQSNGTVPGTRCPHPAVSRVHFPLKKTWGKHLALREIFNMFFIFGKQLMSGNVLLLPGQHD